MFLLTHYLSVLVIWNMVNLIRFKTQFIRFGRQPPVNFFTRFSFCGTLVPFLNSVVHLGHILQYDMDDCDDILQASSDLVCRSNRMLQTFTGVYPFVKTKLLNAFCLSLYGSSLWKLSCKSISIIEVSLNKVLRKVWHLPRNSHTAIVHCTARLYSIFLMLSILGQESYFIVPFVPLHQLFDVSILGQESYFIVPFVPLHQLFDVFSWILHIYVILLLATTKK